MFNQLGPQLHSPKPRYACFCYLLIAFVFGCSPSEIYINLNIQSENQDVVFAKVKLYLNGEYKKTASTDMSDPDSEMPVFMLPYGTSGIIRLLGSGLDAGDCLLETGTVEVEISANSKNPLQVGLALKDLKQPTCRLGVDMHGDGFVKLVVDGNKQICDKDLCEYDIPLNHVVRLTAEPGQKSDLAYWSGDDCSGTSRMCEFSMTSHSRNRVAFSDKICSADDWCLDRGFTLDQSISAVTGMAADDIWVGSAKGFILHWDGVQWNTEYLNKGLPIRSVFSSSPTDVWAVGGAGAIFRYVQNGYWYAFYPLTDAGLYSVWAANPKEVYAVGERSTVLWFNGSSWQALPGSGLGSEWLRGVTAPAAKQWWAVANSGRVLRWDGTVFDVAKQPLRAIWSASADELWVVGDKGSIFHYSPGGAGVFEAVASPSRENLSAIWGSGPDDVWAAGDNGALLHYDGSAWQEVASGTSQALLGLWGTAGSDVWAVGAGGTVLRHRTAAPSGR